MRHAFRPDVVGQIFKLSLSGKIDRARDDDGVSCGRATADKTFDDLLIPLAVMTVDLNARDLPWSPRAAVGGAARRDGARRPLPAVRA